MVDLGTHLRGMAAYNTWANRRVYAAAKSLSDDAYRQDLGLFFGSLHGTLNHLLVTDRLWMKRLTGIGEAPTRLDAILFDQLDELRPAREAEDERIEAYLAQLSGDALAGDLVYSTTSGVAMNQPRWQVLAHIFNHQTHHRGQAHAALTRLGGGAPVLDLLAMQRGLA